MTAVETDCSSWPSGRQPQRRRSPVAEQGPRPSADAGAAPAVVAAEAVIAVFAAGTGPGFGPGRVAGSVVGEPAAGFGLVLVEHFGPRAD